MRAGMAGTCCRTSWGGPPGPAAHRAAGRRRRALRLGLVSRVLEPASFLGGGPRDGRGHRRHRADREPADHARAARRRPRRPRDLPAVGGPGAAGHPGDRDLQRASAPRRQRARSSPVAEGATGLGGMRPPFLRWTLASPRGVRPVGRGLICSTRWEGRRRGQRQRPPCGQTWLDNVVDEPRWWTSSGHACGGAAGDAVSDGLTSDNGRPPDGTKKNSARMWEAVGVSPGAMDTTADRWPRCAASPSSSRRGRGDT